LTPEELYQRSIEQRKALPETEQDEHFYVELAAEVTAFLIKEERPASDKVLLYALEQESKTKNDKLDEELYPAEIPHCDSRMHDEYERSDSSERRSDPPNALG
jgi:hypothetical protein